MNRVAASLAIVALLITVPAIAPAFGVEATPTASPGATQPPAVAGTLDVQWWMEAEKGQAIAIVSTLVDPAAKLPAVVRLPIPPGMTVDWAGEISGGDASQDIQRQFTVKDGVKGTYAEFEVSQYRAAQIDLSGKSLSADGATVSGSLEYVQSVPSSDTAISVRLPPGASAVVIRPAPVDAPSVNQAGETLYALPVVTLKPGDAKTTTVEYASSGSAPASPGGTGAARTANQLIAALGALVVGAIVALVIVVRRQRQSLVAVSGDDVPGPSSSATRSSSPAPPAPIDDSDEPFSLDD